ncbi:unnamed protein product [Pylaiella littoralis]
MPWQSAPPLAIITVAMGAVSGLMSLTNYLTVGRTDRLIGLDDFDYMLLHRDMRIRNPPQAAVDSMLANPVTRSALEKAKADMAAAASKQ